MYYGERLNSITHLVGAALSLVGLGALITIAAHAQNDVLSFSFAVFGFTLVLLYTMSTLYHSCHPPRLKKIFQKLDHISIYLLIAGTYTPFMLVSLSSTSAYLILAIVWSLAIVGIVLDVFIKKRIEWLQVSIYLIMGWIVVFDLAALKAAIPLSGVYWLIAGGLFYTVGVVFYALDIKNKLKHAHGIWHLFVLSGSTSHFISIAVYVR